MYNSLLKKLSYLIYPLIVVLLCFAPIELETRSFHFLLIFLFVIYLWLFTQIPLFISGILGVCLSVIMGITTTAAAFAPFAHPIVFLFLGGFIFAKALEVTELDQRLAYKAMSHPWVQVSPKRIILVFLSLSFFLSMWISNTAAVAMLLPMSYGVLKKLKRDFNIESSHFDESLLLALAYSATVGGNVTPIGSPPNVIAVGHLKALMNADIGFIQWMAMALPFSLIIFFFVYRNCVKELPDTEKKTVGLEVESYRKMSTEQKYVITAFAITVFLWIFPNLLTIILGPEKPISQFIKSNLTTSVVGLLFASTLFIFPLGEKEKVLKSQDISRIDWSSLLLFGSGLSLGKILFDTGLAKRLALFVSGSTSSTGVLLLLIGLVIFTIMFTELASNTASANILIPIMLAISEQMQLNSVVLAFCLALACNSAFMLPVATPPNIIVYGTNRVHKVSMMKAGMKLNILCAIVLALTISVLA
jgi:sodium-dependent dicarboxylate transporter 2/3/5